MAKKDKRKESDVLPADLMELQFKKVITNQMQILEESARREKLLASYQAEPINVIPVEDIAGAVKVNVDIPNEVKTIVKNTDYRVSTIHTKMVDITKRQEEIVESLRKIVCIYDSLAHPKKPEPQGLYERFRFWMSSERTKKSFLKIAMYLIIMIVGLNIIVLMYQTRWSDYAWSLRAYYAIQKIHPDKPNYPGQVFHWTMKQFKEEKRGTVIDEVLSLEKEFETSQIKDSQRDGNKNNR